VPDVAVSVSALDGVDDGFGRIHLVRPEDHELFQCVEHDVAPDHFGQMRRGQERFAEGRKVRDGAVLTVSPIVGLLEGILAAVVGIVLGIDAVAHNQQLREPIQTFVGVEGVLLVAVDLVEGFLHLQAAPLELDLYDGDAVGQNRHVVAVLVAAFLIDLVGDLPLVGRCVVAVKKLDVVRGAVVSVEAEAVAQRLGLLEEIALAQVVQDLLEFPVGVAVAVEGFELGLEVEEEVSAIGNAGQCKPLPNELLDEVVFQLGFALVTHTNIFWSSPFLNSTALSIWLATALILSSMPVKNSAIFCCS